MSLKNACEQLSEKAKEALIDALADLGKDAIDYAFEKGFRSVNRRFSKGRTRKYKRWLKSKGKSTTKAWDDISRRLRDSFGSAVYVNGNLRKDSVRFYEKNPTQRDGWSEAEGGREVLMRYLKSIHPKSKKSEIVLVCVAAMYYAKFLEKGQHRGGYKIKVISGARTYIDKHWKEAVSGIYKKTGLKKPVSFVKKGDNSEL